MKVRLTGVNQTATMIDRCSVAQEDDMSRFIPESIRALFLDALEEVSRPLDREVIARTLQVIEQDSVLLARHNTESQPPRSRWTVNKFGAMAVREALGWEKEEGYRPSARPFTTLANTYTRLIPPEEPDTKGGTAQTTEASESLPDFFGVRYLPEVRDWVTGPQVAETLGITRSAVHKKMMQGEFRTLHRLGDRPHLVVLRSEVEQMKAKRGEAETGGGSLETPTANPNRTVADQDGNEMNEVRLSGWFATEVALSESEGEDQTASFIIRVLSSPEREDFFRIICVGEAAQTVREAAMDRLLLGNPIHVRGSLAQEVLEDSHGNSFKAVQVVANTATLDL